MMNDLQVQRQLLNNNINIKSPLYLENKQQKMYAFNKYKYASIGLSLSLHNSLHKHVQQVAMTAQTHNSGCPNDRLSCGCISKCASSKNTSMRAVALPLCYTTPYASTHSRLPWQPKHIIPVAQMNAFQNVHVQQIQVCKHGP